LAPPSRLSKGAEMAGWIWLHTRALADALGHTRSVIRCAHDRRFRVRRAFPLSFAALMIAVHRRHRGSAFQPSASHLRGLPLCRSQAHDRRFGRPHVTLPFPRGSATSAALLFPIPHQSMNGSMSRSHGTQVIRSGRARDIPQARRRTGAGQVRRRQSRSGAGNLTRAGCGTPTQGVRRPGVSLRSHLLRSYAHPPGIRPTPPRRLRFPHPTLALPRVREGDNAPCSHARPEPGKERTGERSATHPHVCFRGFVLLREQATLLSFDRK